MLVTKSVSGKRTSAIETVEGDERPNWRECSAARATCQGRRGGVVGRRKRFLNIGAMANLTWEIAPSIPRISLSISVTIQRL